MSSASPRLELGDPKRAYWFQGALFMVHLDSTDTEGRFVLLQTLSPPGHTPPLHVHHETDQAWFVLEGELTVYLPGASSVHGPGSVAYGPRGVPHTHPVTSGVPARVLEVSSPAGFERFLEAVGAPAATLTLPEAGEPPDLERISFVAADFGIELLGPPGAHPEG
jgi:mannose-6-phosphate isomerase-like protein (cupin superfamily)